MPNFLNRTLIRRKQEQNGDTAGRAGGRVKTFDDPVQDFPWNLRLTLASFALSSGFLNLFFVSPIKVKHTRNIRTFICPRFFVYIMFTPFKRIVFHVLWSKFVLIIKVDEQVGGEVNFRSFCWRKRCVKDAWTDQLARSSERPCKTFTCIYNKACITNTSISFIEIIRVL